MAFCRWLSHRTGSKIDLPTEWQWQQAATGGDRSRKYPWGGEWDEHRCNSRKSNLIRTTAVGMYLRGATKQGVMDMAGNVFEWCQNKYKDPETSGAVRIDDSGDRHMIRGGSFFDESKTLRASFRVGYAPGELFILVGFRLVQTLPNPVRFVL